MGFQSTELATSNREYAGNFRTDSPGRLFKSKRDSKLGGRVAKVSAWDFLGEKGHESFLTSYALPALMFRYINIPRKRKNHGGFLSCRAL